VSVILADFITGLMHWAEDTWLVPGKSALLDRWIVNDNIDHHRFPGKIRAGQYWATNRVCIALALGAGRGLETLIERCGVKVARATASRGGY